MFHQNVTLGPGTGTFSQHTFEILLMLLGAALLGLWLGWILWNRYQREAEKLRLELVAANTTAEAQRTEILDLKTKWNTLETEHQNLSAQVVSLSRNNTYQRDRIGELEEEVARLEARNRQLETELGLTYDSDSDQTTDTYEVNVTNEEPAAEHEVPAETAPPAQEADPVTLTLHENIPLEIHIPDHTPVVVVSTEVPSLPNLPADEAPVEAVGTHDSASPLDSVTNPLDLVAPATAVVTEESGSAEIRTAEGEERGRSPLPVETPLFLQASDRTDDLTVIEGIGPKIQELLYQYGIRTYHQLASTEVTRIKEILRNAGPQLAMHDPGTWTAQALLAANDQWENLKAYQDYLSAGKSPKAKG